MGYQLLGRAVWFGGKWFLRHRYGRKPQQVAAALIVVGGIGAILVSQRKPGTS
jgi:hypothetical protein